MDHKTKNLIFHFYRYQILPISKQIQITFHPHKITSLEELIKRKNEIFEKVFLETKVFKFSRTELEHKFVDKSDNIFIFKIGANRGIRRIKRDFTEEKIENWPNCLVVINNNRNIQKIAIQQNVSVFWNTQAIVNIIENNLNSKLNAYQLSIVFEPMFEEKVFWDIVNKNKNKVIAVDFELVTPNLSNISSGLSDDLKSLQKTTNTQKTNLKLQSDKDSSLDLSENNNLIGELVTYASQGGGNIKCKIRGYKRSINTSKNIKQESVDEIIIENSTSKNIGKNLPGIADS